MKENLRPRIIEMLTTAYWMEIETVTNYLANSVDLDGVRAEEIKKALGSDITQELTHAQALARRIKEVGGRVPGSIQFKASQTYLQPPTQTIDVTTVIRGVIQAEKSAIEHYGKLIELSGEANDYVTQDLCITQLADEESHLITFQGFLKEYEHQA